VHPYYCHQRICSSDNGSGFLVADPIVDCDSGLPLKYDYLVKDWNDRLYRALSKTGVLPDGRAQDILRSCSQNGYLFLRKMHHILNPNLMDIPSSVCNCIPYQNGEPYDVYVSVMRFFNCMNGFIHNRSTDYGDRHTQDVSLSNIDHADTIMKYIHANRSTVQDLLVRYKKGTFSSNISPSLKSQCWCKTRQVFQISLLTKLYVSHTMSETDDGILTLTSEYDVIK
jgi:hypothetical protein